MKVKSLGKNQTEVHTGNKVILVSYETPVAMIHSIDTVNGKTLRAVKTNKFHSMTTSKHINQWFLQNLIELENIFTMPQEYFDNLMN